MTQPAERAGWPRVLRIERIHEEGRDTRAFDMRAAEPEVFEGDVPAGAGAHGVSFAPGQVAVLAFDGVPPAYFAIASAPEDDELEFLIKRSAGGPGSRVYEMRAGDRAELLEVVGRGFPLGEHAGRDLVFVAMGTGVAPLRSALRHALRRRADFGQLFVLYGARTPEDFCYRDEIEGWRAAGADIRQVISRPHGYEWAGPTGYVQSLLDHVLPQLSDPVALVCGSREMIDETRERLLKMGFAPGTILTNY